MTKVIAWIVAVVSTIAAIALSYIQNVASGLPEPLALALPISFIGFVILIFEVGWGLFIKAHQGKLTALTKLRKDLIPEAMKIVRMRMIGGVLCIIASMTLESVNVVTIMGAQVHTVQSVTVKAVKVASADLSSELTELKADKAKLEADKAKLEKDWNTRKAERNRVLINLYPKMTDRVVSPEYADFKKEELAFDTSSKAYDTKIEAKQTEIEKRRNENLDAKTEESADDNAFVGSVYAFIGKVMGIDAINVQFWMTALPSLFLGIISCVSLSLALYSKPAKKKEEKDA